MGFASLKHSGEFWEMLAGLGRRGYLRRSRKRKEKQ
jgi:hypothetical protein